MKLRISRFLTNAPRTILYSRLLIQQGLYDAAFCSYVLSIFSCTASFHEVMVYCVPYVSARCQFRLLSSPHLDIWIYYIAAVLAWPSLQVTMRMLSICAVRSWPCSSTADLQVLSFQKKKRHHLRIISWTGATLPSKSRFLGLRLLFVFFLGWQLNISTNIRVHTFSFPPFFQMVSPT